jgi:hypothetical protein
LDPDGVCVIASSPAVQADETWGRSRIGWGKLKVRWWGFLDAVSRVVEHTIIQASCLLR